MDACAILPKSFEEPLDLWKSCFHRNCEDQQIRAPSVQAAANGVSHLSFQLLCKRRYAIGCEDTNHQVSASTDYSKFATLENFDLISSGDAIHKPGRMRKAIASSDRFGVHGFHTAKVDTQLDVLFHEV
jgi:hypothetical protein